MWGIHSETKFRTFPFPTSRPWFVKVYGVFLSLRALWEKAYYTSLHLRVMHCFSSVSTSFSSVVFLFLNLPLPFLAPRPRSHPTSSSRSPRQVNHYRKTDLLLSNGQNVRLTLPCLRNPVAAGSAPSRPAPPTRPGAFMLHQLEQWALLNVIFHGAI